MRTTYRLVGALASVGVTFAQLAGRGIAAILWQQQPDTALGSSNHCFSVWMAGRRVYGGQRSGARHVTPRDFSQVPVEQLAHLLLERARHDPSLPGRTPANSNEAPPGWCAPPVAQPCQPWFPERLAEQPRFAGQDRIADLVSQAITAAQEAEDIALATREASRRANRGAAIAMALGTLGAVAGVAGGLIYWDTTPPMYVAAQSGTAAQPAASAPPAAAVTVITHGAGAEQSASVQSNPGEGSAELLPALAPATFVRVLPAVPSPPPMAPPDAQAPARSAPRAGFGHVIGALLRQRVG